MSKSDPSTAVLPLAQNDPALCTGCGACAQACPGGCIAMQRDAEGFSYPVVDTDCCTECGLCGSVCPASRDWRELYATAARPRLFAAWHLDDSIRAASSSGGVFSSLATRVLLSGGLVFGAAFDEGLRLRHVAVTKPDDLWWLRGSKYLQSSTESTYSHARAALDAGQQVLYSGTPCQIAGLYGFLGQDDDRLITVDLVCHGVPSPMVFERYLRYLESESGSTARRADFRGKKRGWRRFSMVVECSNGTTLADTLDRDPYLACFLRNLCLRPSCSSCSYACVQRVADITLGDFWTIGRCHPELDDDRGISEVFVNTEAGQRLFDACRGELFVQECRLEDGVQQSMLTPSVASPQRAAFFADLGRLNFEDIRHKYLRPRRVWYVRRTASYIKRTIKRVLRSLR